MKYTGFTGRWLRVSLIIGLLLITLLMFSACDYDKPIYALAEQVVPFAKSEDRWREHSLIEEDAYGRKLYTYLSQGNGINNAFSDFVTHSSNNPVLFYIISQIEADGAVYCYTSSCYMYVSSFSDVSDAQLENFKQENDWGKPINEEKLTAYAVDDYQEKLRPMQLPTAIENAIAALSTYLGRTIDKYYIDAIMTPQGQPIFVVREVLVWATENAENTENIFGSSYVFTITDSFEVEACNELIGSVDTWPDQLFSFKEQWNKSNGTRDGFVDSSEE